MNVRHFGGLALVLTGFLATAAQATPLTGTFAINVWYGTNPIGPPGHINDPAMQALATNPLLVPANQLYSGTYSGDILFSDASVGGTGNILSFLQSAGGTLSGSTATLNHIMSQGSFKDATLIQITFTTPLEIAGTIDHDDGVSIYDATNTTKLVDASGPTTVSSTSYDLAPGTYNLWYAEVNGTPAELEFNVDRIPEPASLALLGVGIAATGALKGTRRRRRSN